MNTHYTFIVFASMGALFHAVLPVTVETPPLANIECHNLEGSGVDAGLENTSRNPKLQFTIFTRFSATSVAETRVTSSGKLVPSTSFKKMLP